MTLDRMNDLYKKGLYSPINYYLGLLAILKHGADVGVVMGRVPETLLGTILDLAARHRKAKDRTTDPEENTITGNILAWGKSHSLASKPSRQTASRRSVAKDVPSKRQGEDAVETQRPLHVAAEKSRDGSNSNRRVAAKKRVRTVGKGDGNDDGGDEGVTKPKRRRSKPGDVR